MRLLLLLLVLGAGSALAGDELVYPLDYFPDAQYDASVPTPESILGFKPGEEAAMPQQVIDSMRAWADASARVTLVEYARSFEDRPLVYVVITHPDNHARLAEIQADWNKLADPRNTDQATTDRLVQELPAVAWMAYSIHGNETSGTDSALSVTYHLAAAQGEAMEQMLRDLIVIVDPNMNPDGRERTLTQMKANMGATTKSDDQGLSHRAPWPGGRTNHYWFDLNRDWILGVNPEARGRLKALVDWHPLLMVDSHEMGSQSTFLFSPPREPRNPHVPDFVFPWTERFASDQAAALDKFGRRYYTGEWNEDFYPGYSGNWARFRGAIGILYEQARNNGLPVRLENGNIRTYREAVHNQVISSIANLETLQRTRQELAQVFAEHRRAAVDPKGAFGQTLYAILPNAHTTRTARFVDLMRLQGFELHHAAEAFEAAGMDRLGRTNDAYTVPKGSLLIAGNQPLAHMVAAMLDFDPRMTDAFIQKEWEALMRTRRPTLYDTTSWSLPLMHDLPALMLETGLPKNAKTYADPSIPTADVTAGWTTLMIDGRDDGAVAAAGRLLKDGVIVRVNNRETTLDNRLTPRGSLLITRSDNRHQLDGLVEKVDALAQSLGLQVVSLGSGLGPGDLPDLGGSHFPLLEMPRIGVFAHGNYNSYDVGVTWHLLEEHLGIPHTVLNSNGFFDLRRYNVLVMPDGRGTLSAGLASRLKAWVEAGGTLIAIGGSAQALANERSGLSDVRLLENVLGDLDAYEQEITRAWMGRSVKVDPAQIWSRNADGSGAYPDMLKLPKRANKNELQERDAWERIFMPRGAMLAGDANANHWLTFGLGDYVPVLFGNHPVLMSRGNINTAVRIGYLNATPPPPPKKKGAAPEPGKAKRVGWAGVPANHELIVRMGGLLWPQAANRLAHGAYVTQESRGAGQVILFASPPNFRASTLGTARILMNALVYGPGLGAPPPIAPH